jgi:arabinofuranan 3-O-arabinosyltransferase
MRRASAHRSRTARAGDERAAPFLTRRRVLAAYAALSYVPLLLTAPGKVAADTKVYLYTDPARLVARAGWLWDPNVAAGTVTHQTIGYLFPMGPYFWLCQNLGIPDWVAQRIWLGTILFSAAAGAAWLLRRVGVSLVGAAVTGVVYMTSPYIIPYFGRTSALLLPWAALPWLTGLLIVALRRGGWRAPVLFGLVLTLVGGTNASSLVFVAIGPALWLPFALWVDREVSVRRSLAVVGRLAITCIPAQLWWLAGLRMQGRYGLPILELTESVQTVAQTSTAPEIGRGMGYWYAYGRDGLSAWTPAATGYTQHLWLIATSFALPSLALVSAVFVRWRHRPYFVSLLVVGLVMGVGTYPYDDPPLFGWLVKTAAARSAAGLALRNTPRAVPLLTLATAALVGVGADAAVRALRQMGRPILARPLVAGLCVLALLNLPSLFAGQTVPKDLRFREELPGYWLDATRALDAEPFDDGRDDTRVLELPGSDFAVYRWGQTQDPITPGLMDRPWAGRELTAYGTPGTVDLLRALDRRIQEGVFDARSIAPIARLLAAGDVLWRSDTQYERYRGPRPRTSWQAITAAPGLDDPVGYGDAVRNTPDPRRPMRDEAELATPTSLEDPPPLATFGVEDAPSIVRAHTAELPLLVSGDGESLVDAAEAGRLQDPGVVLYAASFAADGAALQDALDDGADLLVTDGNRKRAQRWGTVRDNNGFTEQPDSKPLEHDPKDTRLEVFPGQAPESQTVADFEGIADVQASTYGNTVAYAPDSRPFNAVDGDPRTAWQVGGFADVVGERLRITLDEPVTADRINVTQLGGNRFITTLGVKLDGTTVTTADMDDASFSDHGQDIVFDQPHTFRSVELSIEASNVEGLPNYLGWSTAGLREVRVGDMHAEELIRVPTDLLSRSDDHNLSLLLSRWRADPAEPFRADPEPRLLRAIDLPSARTFTLTGEARLEPRADGATIDSVIGRPGTADGYATADGTDFLAASALTRPSSAIDGDPTTAWVPNLGGQIDRRFHVTLPGDTTIDHLDLTVLADGWHSVPTQITLDLDEGSSVVVDLPQIADGDDRDANTTVPVDVPAFTTQGFTVRVTGVRDVSSIEYFSGEPGPLPVGIVDLGIADVRAGPLPAQLPTGCRDDLLTVDGSTVSVRITGTVADAVARQPLAVEPCTPIGELGPGRVVLRSANGIDTGLAIDRLRLESHVVDHAVAAPPAIQSESTGRLSYDVQVSGAENPFWLVLGQSHSDGWEATINGKSLGTSTLVDGYANGWRIDPTEFGESFTVTLRWTPQRVVWAAIIVSALALIALVGAAVVMEVRRRRGAPYVEAIETEPAETEPAALAAPWSVAMPQVRHPAWYGMAFTALAWAGAGVVAGVVVGTLVVVALVVPRGRILAAALVVSAYPVTAAWYVLKQWRNHYSPGVEWPHVFGFTHTLVLSAVLTLGAFTLLDLMPSRRRPSPARERAFASARDES